MKQRGSITVFSALAFMLVASFLFALLEAGRQYQLDLYADMSTSLAIESVCAEYQPKLWQDYHLLGLDGSYGGEIFSMEQVTGVLGARVRANLAQEGAGSRLMGLSLDMAYPKEYQLLTDGDGSVFLHCVSTYMKENLTMEAAQLLYEQYTQGAVTEKNGQAEGSVEQAQMAVEEALAQREAAKQEQGMQEQTEVIVPDEPVSVQENPLEVVLAAKQNLLLGMVVEDAKNLSTVAIDLTEALDNRICQKGTADTMPDIGWYEKVLALEYLGKYFGDYRTPAEGHVLAYELEYVLCGKQSDRDNLEGVVGRLLLLREAANMLHIISDSEKQGAAMALATALVGFTGNTAIIKMVQIGIMAAWAYAESILDLRALLAGNKIALLKSREQWTTQLGSLAQIFAGGQQAKNCENGLSYQNYLKGFLFMMKEKNLAYRMMGIMEQNIRQIPVYHNCRMDHILCALSYEVSYTAQPLFWDLSILQQPKLMETRFDVSKSFSYY